jgi:hypothetical protein
MLTLLCLSPFVGVAAADDVSLVESRVTVTYQIELPGCQYRRESDDQPEMTNIAIKGTDVLLQLVTPRDTMEYSHRTLALADIKYDHRGFPVKKTLRDTVIVDSLQLLPGDTLTVGLRVFANPKSGFVDRDKLTAEIRSYIIPADFNAGRPIELRLRVLKDGTISIRYY